MRSFASLAFVSSLLLASSASAQILTTTLPWVDGNTLVISVGTNAAGLPVTSTVSLVGPDDALPPTPTTTPTTTRRTTTTRAAADDGDDERTTTTQRVVGQETTGQPMRTTTYGYNPGDGGWTSGTWTASVTVAPTVATAIVAEGTIQDYQAYQSEINSVALASAEKAIASSSGKTGAASREMGSIPGWVGMAVGMIGAAVGVLGI